MTGPAAAAAPAWDVDALLDDPGTEIVLCCGAGGVGKTTTAAALALRAAERGRRVAVLTIDPARRLAQALGLTDDDGPEGLVGTSRATDGGEPVAVPGVDTSAGGSLDALVLDSAGTLDALVEAALPPDQAAAVRANPVYASVSSSFSGTQEYMAMERLGQLRTAARAGQAPWDLIVVDTPPSRSALDFLDAPERLASFLDGRFVRLLLAPARLAGGGTAAGSGGRAGPRAAGRRLVGAVVGGVGAGIAGVMDRVLGARLLRDVEALVAGLDTVFGGFRTRAASTTAALSDQRTAFVVIAAAERDPLAEAVYFLRRLREQRITPAGLVVNRATRAVPGLSAATATEAAQRAEEPARAVLRLQADLASRAARESQLVDEALSQAGERGLAVAVVGAQRDEVVDLEGLRAIGAELAGGH